MVMRRLLTEDPDLSACAVLTTMSVPTFRWVLCDLGG